MWVSLVQSGQNDYVGVDASCQRKIDMAKQVARHGQIAFSFSNSLGGEGGVATPSTPPLDRDEVERIVTAAAKLIKASIREQR